MRRGCWWCGRAQRRSSRTASCATCRTCCAPGDALVVNDTKVIPARLHGRRIGRGDRAEDRGDAASSGSTARAGAPSCKPAKRLAAGDVVRFGDEGKVCFLGQLDATVEDKGEGGEVTLAFAFHGPVLDQAIAERGDMPLPPYIAARRAGRRARPRRLPDHVRRATRARSRRRPPGCISPTRCWRGSRARGIARAYA